jgi:hypothetical protein
VPETSPPIIASGPSALPDLDSIRAEIAAGYICARPHPTLPYVIYNYTSKAQFDQHWNPATLACRGLILHTDGHTIARPFQKFFSIDQYPGPIPLEPFEVFEKLDGSLGIIYFADGLPCVATRGSFDSPQAYEATSLLRSKVVALDERLTYLVEIVYPENRIVVDYGQTRDLFLLTAIETETGHELGPVDIGLPMVKRYDGIQDIAALSTMEVANQEGFVVRFESGLRLKVKFEEYKRLHKLLTGINPRHVWEMIRDGQSIEALIDRVPDEFYAWIKGIDDGLRARFALIEEQCRQDIQAVKPEDDRKTTALYFQKCGYPSVLFAMLDRKEYAGIIWKMLKPEASATFKRDDF